MADVAVCLRFFLALLFLSAGVSKLRRRPEFTAAVTGYELGPRWATPHVARWLPWLEILFAALLFLGFEVEAASAAIGALLATFCLAVTFNLVRGRRIECGCFVGGLPRKISWPVVCRNALLSAFAVSVSVRHPTILALDDAFSRAPLRASDGTALLLTSTLFAALAALIGNALRLRALTAAASQEGMAS